MKQHTQLIYHCCNELANVFLLNVIETTWSNALLQLVLIMSFMPTLCRWQRLELCLQEGHYMFTKYSVYKYKYNFQNRKPK